MIPSVRFSSCAAAILLWVVVVGSSCAFSHSTTANAANKSFRHQQQHAKFALPVSLASVLTTTSTLSPRLVTLRGGQQEQAQDAESDHIDLDMDSSSTEETTVPVAASKETQSSSGKARLLASVAIPLTSFGNWYAASLIRSPILTKSVTAGITFALSDILAQRLEKQPIDADDKLKARRKLVWTRIAASAAVGFFYFGPAAHYWYEWVFRILPGTTLPSILQKAALGQMLFGPTFTCIFFASGLLQSGSFSLKNWIRKIRQDLPGAWIAGAGFWPIVDVISFSLVPPQMIPLFINMCSLIWTTYLVLKSYN
jgi:protein Mpv17